MAAAPRIVSLLASGTEILCGIGMLDALVAISHECDYPPEITSLPRVTSSRIDDRLPSADIDRKVRETAGVGESLYALDVETIASLHPDLLVTQSQCDVCAVSLHDVERAVATDSRLRDTRVFHLNPVDLETLFRDIVDLGRAAGREQAAREFLRGLRDRVEAVRRRSAPPDDRAARPAVCCIEWIEPLMLAGNWIPEMIELAGGRHDLTTTGAHSPSANLDEVVDYDPESIIISPCGFDLRRTIEESRSLWDDTRWTMLRAVRSGRVYAVDGNAYMNRSGPRIVDSLEIVAHLVDPDRHPCPRSEVGRAWQRLAEPVRSP